MFLSAGTSEALAVGEAVGGVTPPTPEASVSYGWPVYRRRRRKQDAERDIEEAAQLVQADAKASEEAKARAQALTRAARAAQGFRELRLLDAQVRGSASRPTRRGLRDSEETVVTWLTA